MALPIAAAIIPDMAGPAAGDEDEQLNGGVALVNVNLRERARTPYLPESVCVNGAVTTDDPAVNTLTRLLEAVATDVVA